MAWRSDDMYFECKGSTNWCKGGSIKVCHKSKFGRFERWNHPWFQYPSCLGSFLVSLHQKTFTNIAYVLNSLDVWFREIFHIQKYGKFMQQAIHEHTPCFVMGIEKQIFRLVEQEMPVMPLMDGFHRVVREVSLPLQLQHRSTSLQRCTTNMLPWFKPSNLPTTGIALPVERFRPSVERRPATTSQPLSIMFGGTRRSKPARGHLHDPNQNYRSVEGKVDHLHLIKWSLGHHGHHGKLQAGPRSRIRTGNSICSNVLQGKKNRLLIRSARFLLCFHSWVYPKRMGLLE